MPSSPQSSSLPQMILSHSPGRTSVGTGTAWESKVGYSRAVRVRDLIFVTGTVGVLPDGTYPSGAVAQARRALQIIEAALLALGAKPPDVVRTRMFVTDISAWRDIGAVHAEFFGHVRPATTMVQVAGLIDADALVEIEADAVVPPAQD